MAQVVYVVTAWDERTNEDTVIVYAEKSKADAAWAKLDGPTVYGGVYRRAVKPSRRAPAGSAGGAHRTAKTRSFDTVGRRTRPAVG